MAEITPLNPEQATEPAPKDDELEGKIRAVFKKLRLLETAEVQGWWVTRVPGGWIMAKPALTGTNQLAPGRSVAAVHMIQQFIPERRSLLATLVRRR